MIAHNLTHAALDLGALGEVTLEANPATFDTNKARHFRALGINRVSLGIQSFTPHVLTTLGREHSREQAIAAVGILREAGMPSVNIDLMFSIPGQSHADWRETLTTTVALQPDHVSAYNLTYEEDTEFLARLTRGEFHDDTERGAADFLAAEEILGAAGFHHYETSNYARPGHASLHNQGYWQGNDYLGLGPSAVSTIAGQRRRNIPDTNAYIRMVQHVGHATCEAEALDAEALRIERLALLLRTSEGAPLALLDPPARARLAILQQEGLAATTTTHFHLTGRGPLLVDEIVAQLI